MNILVLNYEFPPIGGGAAPLSRDLAIELAKRGHNVDVVTMKYGNLPCEEYVDGIHIIRIECMRKKQNSCSPIEQLSFLFYAAKYFKESHPHNKSANKRWDVCHCHFIVPTAPLAFWLKHSFNIPYIITAHGSDVPGHNTKFSVKTMLTILTPLWKKLVKEASYVISPSTNLQELMTKCEPRANYIFLPNGIDLKKYERLSSKHASKKSILVMGRLQKFKNVTTILEAIAKSKDEIQGWTVDILGDGPDRKRLEKITKQLGIDHIVNFHGWINNNTPEQLEHIQNAKIYISASTFENCPMSVLETIAAGCYPLLSDIPGHRNLVRQNDIFFSPLDSNELAQKLKETINHSKIFKEDISRYDWNIIAEEYLKYITLSKVIEE